MSGTMKFATKPPARVEWGVVDSPAGKLVVGVTDKGEICRVTFLKKDAAAECVAEWQGEWPQTEFIRGAEVVDFTHQSLLLVGTAFQQKVWREMAKIPAGRVATYGDLAQRIGQPKASRAVGAACGANPVPYLVPCHRVVAANGGLGGFSSGLDVKKKLLKAEGVAGFAVSVI
jgi:O-6-methylguanine DNA methyltransferase